MTTQPAYVLHQWDWSETSLIVDLFTRGQGRVAVVAKGAKRPYSQLRPVLVSFQRLQVQLGRVRTPAGDGGGGADVLNLRAADYAGAGIVLPPARLMAGFYCNELLLKLLARGDPHEQLFDAYAATLAALARADAEADEEAAALRAFELLLLRETGVLPELDKATPTQRDVAPDARYRLRPEQGLVAVDDPLGTTLPGAACLALARALADDDLPALRHAARSVLPALRQQLRGLLHYHLGSPQLRTRELMLDVRRLLDTRPPAASTADA